LSDPRLSTFDPNVSSDTLTGDRRCWPCTVLNGAVGVLVGWSPVAAAAVRGDPSLLAGSLLWAVVVTLFTAYRLLRLGYLPYAEPVARRTGLHDYVDPTSDPDDDRDG
jgi:hypothetical protein